MSLGGNVNKRRMSVSQPDMWSIFHIKNQWNILAIENYYVNYQNVKKFILLSSPDTKRRLMQYVRRVYATINFPSIITLIPGKTGQYTKLTSSNPDKYDIR